MKRFVLFLLLFGLGLALAQPKYGGVLRAGMQTDPVGLDPHTSQATATRNMLENTYDTLVMLNENLEIVPGLAESWEASEDGLAWTFNLREGVTFHNGDPLKASDVVFSLNRIKDPDIASPRAGDFEVISNIEAADDSTVVVTLSQPFSPLLSKLAFSMNAIVSEAVAMANNNDLNDVVVGTGPFKFIEYIPQTRMVLEKNENFWGTDANGNQLPYLDGITFTFYPEPTARTTAVQTGNVDWIEYVPAPDVDILKADSGVEVVGGLATNFRSIYINTSVAPLDNALVRDAIAYAVDEQAVVDVALFGTGGVAADGTTIPSSAFYGISSSPYIGRDVEKAKELLAEAGFADGFEFDMYVTSTYDFLRTPAEIIQSNLAEIGITMNIVAEDWSVYLPKVIDGDFTATILGNSGLADPDDYLYDQFHTGGNGNFGGYSNAELDALLEQGRQVSDPEERKAIYTQAQELILAESPMVFLFHSAQYEAHGTNVKGFKHYQNTGYLSFRETWLE
ncbi:MAG: ABC transporter substrate-binding protein [Trueperaceae bacterium]|nr:ABC transporter substrate-binding protein [Trueperaceae bacterium]